MSLPVSNLPNARCPARFWLPQFCNVAPLAPIGPSLHGGHAYSGLRERQRDREQEQNGRFVSSAAMSTPEHSPVIWPASVIPALAGLGLVQKVRRLL